MMVQYDQKSGVFVLTEGGAGSFAEVHALNEALAEVRGRLNLKRRSGNYAHGFLIEMVLRLVQRYFVHGIYDELGKLDAMGQAARRWCHLLAAAAPRGP